MADNKPIAYPKLMDTLTTLVNGHAQMHDTIVEHATNHVATLENNRRALSIKRDAQRLMTDNSSLTDNT